MRLPRLRFTVRSLMVAVAILGVLALVFRSYETNRRKVRFDALANYHRMMEVTTAVERYGPDGAGHNVHSTLATPRSQFHNQMSWKYENASNQPWLPVESDPPEPK